MATAIALPVEKTDTETSPNPGRLEARVVADFFNYIAAKELTPTIPTCCDATPLAAYSSNQDCRFISNMDMARGPDEPILSFCYGAGKSLGRSTLCDEGNVWFKDVSRELC